jgi:6-phosphogluconolactonase (cycloisomerase 2 family)
MLSDVVVLTRYIICIIVPGQADPFESSHGGVPHDRSKIGTGVLAIGVDHEGFLSYLNNGEPVVKAEDLPNPSYLSFNERMGDAARLCVVSELGEGKWQAFRCSFDGEAVNLTASGGLRDSGGAYPCHVTHTAISGQDIILISNYGEEHGVFSIAGYDDDVVVKQVFGVGSRVDNARQQSSHAHSVCVVPPVKSSSSVDVCSADLGSDALIQFSIMNESSSNGVSLQCVEKGRLAAPPGSGPRSLMFNPKFYNVAVVSLEMTGAVWLIRQRPHDGCLEGVCPPISLLPEDWPAADATEMQFNRGRWASDAIWSPDGQFVYAAARLHDSISVFELTYEIDSNRDVTCPKAAVVRGLELKQQIHTGGRTPRCLTMSECGEFLLVANQQSHDVTSFRRCSESGKLVFVNRLDVNCAACVKLLRPKQIISK